MKNAQVSGGAPLASCVECRESFVRLEGERSRRCPECREEKAESKLLDAVEYMTGRIEQRLSASYYR